MSIQDLPIELLNHLFTYLPDKTLLKVQIVCRKWNIILKEEKIWKTRFYESFLNWYTDIEYDKPWKERFWKIYQLHQNWKNTKTTEETLRSYLRTIRQIQVTGKYLGVAVGDEIEIRDPVNYSELFNICPDNQDRVPYVKCFSIYGGKLACSSGNDWTHINIYDLEQQGRLSFGWTNNEPYSIDAIAFSADKLVTGSRKCIVWDLPTRTPLITFSEQQRGVVNCIQFDDNILVCSHKGRKVRIWDIKSAKRIYTIQGHQHLVHCLQYNDKFLATGSKDKTIRIWDRSKGYHCSGVLRGHEESVRCLSLQGWSIVSGSKDGDIRIWDITSDIPNRMYTDLDGNRDGTNGYSSVRTRSIGRLQGSDPVSSLATTPTRLYVGSQFLRVYDFTQQTPKKQSVTFSNIWSFLNGFMKEGSM